ncbi:STAS/SEC14 domain-containing protein [Algoriphagus sp.]|uniref:STAS/SEC14 domain-containing protein n=1 Tax=Algoriphagus sp. TaxID=1872435 RepID=UPI00391D2555
MDSYAIIDESEFPIIRIDFTGNKSTDQNFQAYLDQMKSCYRTENRLAIIFDASRASIPAFPHQKIQANWLRENDSLMKDFCAGTAYIIPNAAIRAILRVIFSLQKQPVPFKVFEKEIDAEEWVNSLELN